MLTFSDFGCPMVNAGAQAAFFYKYVNKVVWIFRGTQIIVQLRGK